MTSSPQKRFGPCSLCNGLEHELPGHGQHTHPQFETLSKAIETAIAASTQRDTAIAQQLREEMELKVGTHPHPEIDKLAKAIEAVATANDRKHASLLQQLPELGRSLIGLRSEERV